MRKATQDLCKTLEASIQKAYDESPTVPEAERLAALFLKAQMVLAQELQVADLNARMRKSGLKAIKAAVYMEAATKVEKKPSDTLLNYQVDLSDLVTGEQRAFDEAETESDLIQNFLNIAREGHIYFRGIAKGNFGG